MVGIHTQRASPQRGEVHHRSRHLRANAFEPFEPLANLVRPVLRQKVQRQRPVPSGDSHQRRLDTWRFHLRKRDAGNSLFDLCRRSVTQFLPRRVAPLQSAHHIVRVLGLRPRRQQRVNQLRQRIPLVARRRPAIPRKQQAMDAREPRINWLWKEWSRVHSSNSSPDEAHYRCALGYPSRTKRASNPDIRRFT